MDIKFLKLIVIFFGILIFFGLIILTVGIYHKFNNLKKKNLNTITLKLEKESELQDFYIFNDNIVIKYKLGTTNIINIYDIFSGKQIKKIELLK